MQQALPIDRKTIERVLSEEDQWFLKYHHRVPIGRESEDVVDNAYTRLCQSFTMPYVVISDIYHEMRCKHA